jgi:RNA polymerase-associated protein
MATNRHGLMTVYSGRDCPLSHQTRIVIHEKGIEANLVYLDKSEWPEEVAAVNPYATGPTLIDRDLVLFNASIINDYLDERFPHPSLMPVDPVARAKARLTLLRIDRDWYSLWDALINNNKKARKMLTEDLTVLAPLFAEYPYFMGDEFSLLDCSIAPILWRLPALNIRLSNHAKAVLDYAHRIFSRDSFQASLTDKERAMVGGVY